MNWLGHRWHVWSSGGGVVRAERAVERRGGHPAADHLTHAREALEWLTRAQDAHPDSGIARGYSLRYSRYFGLQGWQPSYPETTGYIIPTLFLAAERFDRPELRERALRAADWEVEIQLPSGGVRAGVMGQPEAPAVFNTGQVILGWVAAFLESGDERYAAAVTRAGHFLVSVLGPQGLWDRGDFPFADARATLYNARTAWALAEAGVQFDRPDFVEAARRNLLAVARLQHPNGWFPNCCLNDPVRPLLHTLAYTIRGMIEGGRVLDSEEFLHAATRALRPLVRSVREDGSMPGRFDSDWNAAVSWSCLTGQAQLVNILIRFAEIGGDDRWLAPVPRMIDFLKRSQNRDSGDPGLRGGIKGSFPLDGGYAPYETLSWATKFFLDALLRLEVPSVRTRTANPTGFLA